MSEERTMAECMTCGDFVSDDYARVFGNNDNEIDSCRGCRADRGTDQEEAEAEQPVLLRDVRGTDSNQVGRRAGVTSAAADGDEASPDATAEDTDADEAEDVDTSGRFGIDSIRSTIRSIAR
jgi:hypothetical protein